mgnify:CR=1 FL=1
MCVFQGAAPTREDASVCIVIHTRALANNSKQVEIYNQLKEKFGRGRSFWLRLTFIKICKHTLDSFSHNFFKENVVATLLKFAKVTNYTILFNRPFLNNVLTIIYIHIYIYVCMYIYIYIYRTQYPLLGKHCVVF